MYAEAMYDSSDGMYAEAMYDSSDGMYAFRLNSGE
jgi:hypothetical protein